MPILNRYTPMGSPAPDYVGQNWALQNRKAEEDARRRSIISNLIAAISGQSGTQMTSGGGYDYNAPAVGPNSYLGRLLGGSSWSAGETSVGGGGVNAYTTALGGPSQTAYSNANAITEAANQRATTETGMAAAGGAYGSTRGALGSAARNRSLAAANARASAAPFIDSDLDRQLNEQQFNASQRQSADVANQQLAIERQRTAQNALNSLFGMFRDV